LLKKVLEENGGFLIRFEMFNEMKRVLEETFGSGAKVILATMAKPCGQRICTEIMEKTKTKEEALNKLSELMGTLNWGELSFFDVDFDKGSGRAIVRNSFEARKCMSKAPCCHFLANLIAGFIAELFAKNVIVNEVKCAGKGDDHCAFRF